MKFTTPDSPRSSDTTPLQGDNLEVKEGEENKPWYKKYAEDWDLPNDLAEVEKYIKQNPGVREKISALSPSMIKEGSMEEKVMTYFNRAEDIARYLKQNGRSNEAISLSNYLRRLSQTQSE